MLRMHRAVSLLVPLVILVPETVAADNQTYLLNCREIDRSNPVYKRYCSGQSGEQGQLRCQNNRCIRIITNFNLQNIQTPKGGNGPAITSTVASTSGVAGIGAVNGAVSTDGGAVGGTVSTAGGAVGGAVSTAGGAVGGVGSGLTGAVSKAVGGLGL